MVTEGSVGIKRFDSGLLEPVPVIEHLQGNAMMAKLLVDLRPIWFGETRGNRRVNCCM